MKNSNSFWLSLAALWMFAVAVTLCTYFMK